MSSGSLATPDSAATPPALPGPPEPIYSCPACSHYLPEGTLACPDCQAMVYAGHLKQVAEAAMEAEREGKLEEARDIWQQGLHWIAPGTRQAEAVQQRITLLDTRMRGAEERKARWTKRLGPLAPVVFFLGKLKSLVFLLFKAKFLLSFIGFFAIYWAIFGWKFGLGFAGGILIHEMGHYIAAKRRGLKVDLPVFLPGLGAYVRWWSMGTSLEDLSSIALAGPFFGLLTAGAFGVAARLSHGALADLMSALAHVTAWLNLMNLIPVLGLDGAQATYALNRTQRWLILGTSLAFFWRSGEWILLFIALGMGWRIWQGGVPEQPSTRTLIRYVLLLFFLGVVISIFPDTSRGLQPY